MKSKYYLWQLYHSQLDAETAAEELESKQAELRAAAMEMKAADTALKEKKKEIAGLNKQRVLMEQKAKKQRAEADKKASKHSFICTACSCWREACKK